MPSIVDLMKSWSEEISSRANRVRLLIGDAHWLSDGSHKEELLREFIRPRLPPAATATHGFLLDLAEGHACSPEIDVLVRDQRNSSPYFSEGGLTIADARDAIAYWQVKSAFASGHLHDAVEHIAAVQTILAKPGWARKVWRGICFMSCSETRTGDSILKSIKTQFEKVAASSSSLELADRLPTCIVAMPKFVVFVDRKAAGRVRLRYFDVQGLSFAVAVADMLSHVYARCAGASPQPLERAIEALETADPIVMEF